MTEHWRQSGKGYSLRFILRLRLNLRMAFFFAIRRCSLLDTNHRFRRMTLILPLLATFLRNRLNKFAWVSFGLSSTFANFQSPFLLI